MKLTASIVLSCLVLSTFAQGVRASRAVVQDSAQEAKERLKLSKDQTFSNHDLALATAREALALFQKANDNAGIAGAYFQIGSCYHAMSDFTQAADNYQTALKLFRELNDVHKQAGTLILLAFIEQRKGEWANAISYYNQAQTLSPNDPIQMGQIATGLADLFSENGDQESALAQFEHALDSYRQANYDRGINNTLINIGYTKFLQGNYTAALTDLQTALKSSPSPLDTAWSHEDLGRVYLALGEYAVALQHLEPALSTYENSSNPAEAERVRTLIGQVYESQGQLDRARPLYLQALGVSRRLQDRISEALVYFRLGKLELKANRLDEAESYLKQSIENTEDIRRISVGRDLTTAYSASVHDRYEAYITCLLRKSKSGAPAELNQRAFEASELSRARSLVELLRDTQTNLLTGVDPQLVQKEKSLRLAMRTKIDARVELLASKNYKQEDLNALETTLDRLRAEHDELAQQLRQLNPAYDQVTQPTGYSLQQVQSKVIDDDQTAVLEYFLADDVSYAWVVTRNDIKLTELPGKATIETAVQNLYRLLSAKPEGDNDSAITKAAEDLSAMVLKPVADQLPARRIIVVADGALNYIPFQLLPSPSDREPLIASREIINAPSASILGQLRQERLRRAAPERVLAAFGYPAFESNYAELRNTGSGELLAQGRKDESAPFSQAMRDIELSGDSLDMSAIQPLQSTRAELANLREVAGPQSLIASGFAASRETLEHTDLSKFAILHLATHAFLDPKRPEYSGFVLSTVGPDGGQQKGYITVQDVYGLQAPVQLVVLSACRTGLGRDIRGEGLISLTRGFMYAGASSIAASLWNVNDEATAELMKHFYTNMLEKGMTPAAALRAAQNTIRQQPLWRSPHYWAAFTLQGEYEQPIRVPGNAVFTARNIIVAVVLVLLLSTAGWWYWRHSIRKS